MGLILRKCATFHDTPSSPCRLDTFLLKASTAFLKAEVLSSCGPQDSARHFIYNHYLRIVPKKKNKSSLFLPTRKGKKKAALTRKAAFNQLQLEAVFQFSRTRMIIVVASKLAVIAQGQIYMVGQFHP